MAKMWAGRFSKELDKTADDFNSSIHFDCKMFRQDIRGSMAHAAMLGAQDIIPQADADTIIEALGGILEDLENGKLSFVDTDVSVAAPRLARRLVRGRLASDKDVSFITVIYGDNVSERDAEAVCENIRGKMARMGVEADVSAIPGGQPVYYYFISVE